MLTKLLYNQSEFFIRMVSAMMSSEKKETITRTVETDISFGSALAMVISY